jgi:hypothetical protein
MIIIGVSGKAGAGKDAAAAFLCNDLSFVRIALADEIKRTAQRWFGFSYSQLWGDSEMRGQTPESNPTGPTARLACQFIGTEVGRALGENVWVDLVGRICVNFLVGMPSTTGMRYAYAPERGLYQTEGWASTPPGIVIPDVRFKNEVDAIKSWGGKLVRVKRKQTLVGTEAGHASEVEQDEIPDSEFDVVIDNNGTLASLGARILQYGISLAEAKNE